MSETISYPSRPDKIIAFGINTCPKRKASTVIGTVKERTRLARIDYRCYISTLSEY